MEQTTWNELRTEAEAKTGRLELLVSRGELDAQAGALMARLHPAGAGDPPREVAGPPAGFPYRTPGDYVLGYMRMKHGDTGRGGPLHPGPGRRDHRPNPRPGTPTGHRGHIGGMAGQPARPWT